jgi:TRAP-type C4-dicarboxylate transport system permease small subunit
MTFFSRTEKISSMITRGIALIGLALLLLIALATVLDVLLRWLFNNPIVGLADTYSLFMAMILASCFPLCIYYRGNVTIRFLGNFFGPRVKNILDAFGNLITMIIFALMAWQFWIFTDELVMDGETTWVLNLPVSPWWRVVTILIFICTPVTLVTFIQYTKAAFKKEKPSDTAIPTSVSTEEGNE